MNFVERRQLVYSARITVFLALGARGFLTLGTRGFLALGTRGFRDSVQEGR